MYYICIINLKQTAVMSTYAELHSKQPELQECFFAFSKEQFEEGLDTMGIRDKKIYNGGGGLYGTKEGIHALFSFYDNLNKEISETCDPQEVYDDEFINYECDYVCDDYEAINIVVNLFGPERAKSVVRRRALIEIDDLKNVE